MLKRHGICRSKADVELIPKICLFYQNRSMAFFKLHFASDTIFFSLASGFPRIKWQLYFVRTYWIFTKKRAIHIAKINAKYHTRLSHNVKTDLGELFPVCIGQSHVLWDLKPPVMANWCSSIYDAEIKLHIFSCDMKSFKDGVFL